MPNEKCPEMSKILEDASNGNSEAAYCLRVAVTFFHMSDDLVDGDTVVNIRNLSAYTNVLARLLTCEFFAANKGLFQVQLLMIGDDYAASMEDPKWEALRHCGNNFVRLVALITGGEPLFLDISKRLREISLRTQY